MKSYTPFKLGSYHPLIWLVLTISGCSTAYQERIPNVDHHYPVHIGAENHIVQGRVSAEAEYGDLVPSNIVLEGNIDADDMQHLRVEVRDSVYKRPHVFHPNHKANKSHPEEFPNSTLPVGMVFVIIHSDAFYVNEDRFIAVKDFSHLNGETRIHFDVILKDTLAVTKYVSNHLPFVVEIEYPKRDLNPNAVLFAGVLVFMILAISLLIPFVVRTKRRCKAGKPIFRCGSSDGSSDSDSIEYLRRKNSIGGKDNLAMMLESGRMKCPRSSVDQHTTIGHHMLRSTSSFNFQPHWLDPHYNDVYVRPDYSLYNLHSPLDKQENSGSEKDFALAGSVRSCESGGTNHVGNCNKNIAKTSDERDQIILRDEKGSGVSAKGTGSLKVTGSPTTDTGCTAETLVGTKVTEKF